MSLFNFDLVSKILISLVFRLIIVLFAIYILISQSNQNFFSHYVYVIIIVAYMYIYIKTLENQKSNLRLINDFFFIGLVLLGKDLTIISNLAFVFLPFFNAPNHTQKNRNVLFLSGITCITLFFLTFFNNLESFTYEYIDILVSLSIITLIIYFEQKRSFFFNKLLEVFELIDEKVTPSNKITNIHEVLKKTIDIYNNDILKNIFNSNTILKSIICINITSYINIRTGTLFVKKVNLDDSDIKKLKNADNYAVIENIEIKYDDETSKETIVIKIMQNRKSFYFILVFNDTKNLKNIFLRYLVTDFFLPIFKKTVHRMIYESKIRSTSRKQLSKLVNNLDYVTTTNNSLHYLRNKFGPIQTYFDLLNKYDVIENEGQKSGLNKLIERERSNAERAIIEIQNRANYILDKSNNPFEVKNLQDMKTKHVWMIVIDSWKFIFKNDNEVVTNISDEDLNQYTYSINSMLFDILITDIIINMKKYSYGSCTMNISLINETKDLLIIFKNQLDSEDKDKMAMFRKLVKHFNDDNRYEINRSSTHGFSQIKEMSHRLNMDVHMDISSNELTTTLLILRRDK